MVHDSYIITLYLSNNASSTLSFYSADKKLGEDSKQKLLD